MPTAFFRAVAPVALAGLLAGCRAVPAPVVSYRLPSAPRGIVLVVDGAGGDQAASRAIANVVEDSRLPLYVRSFEWTHGVGRGVADMTDVNHARIQAKRLAGHVGWYRTHWPHTPIYLVAYSAGTMVTLEAAQGLESNSVERIVLLAPAVSADYDLRCALFAARQGVDVFTSERDRLYLDFGTRLVGTADGKRGVPAAGRVGFDMPVTPNPDPLLTSRLRQHPWDPSVAWTGNSGDHDGALRSKYLRAYVLPLLTPSPQASHGE